MATAKWNELGRFWFALWMAACVKHGDTMIPTEISEVPVEGPAVPLWRRGARVARRWVRRHRLLVVGLAAPPFVLLGVLGFFYLRYSIEIDQQLSGGAFGGSLNIFGAPFVVGEGDVLSQDEVKGELKQAGFEDSRSGKAGTFRSWGGILEVFPRAGSSQRRVRIVFGGPWVERIEADGQAARTWLAGDPLIANLTAGRKKRHLVTFHEIPMGLVQAVVSAEDRHFFHHNGLDVGRIAKAAWVDFREGRKAQGASTLTMQLVRGLWLTPEKDWKRKAIEALMTVHLETKWSKEEIFAAYANQVYLGQQEGYSIYGFAQGAEMFFGKSLRDLNLQEAALLAGMVQRPSYFNPNRHPERAGERRDLVLGLMRETGAISEGQRDEALASPVLTMARQQRDDTFGAPYFLDLVTDEMQVSGTRAEDARNVYTTIDLNLQRAAGEAVAAGMEEVDKLLAKKAGGGAKAEAALIALDPHTGEIKAMIGGRDYARSQLNRILARRPPGSVFKPFVYAAALNTAIEGGARTFTLASTVDDAPTTFYFDGKPYRPANFRNEEFGTLTFRQALAKSDNVAAVKVAEWTGLGAVVAMAKRAGLNEDIRATPAVALGSYGVTPFEIAGAYTAFANGGLWEKPQLVSRALNDAGETLYGGKRETRQAMDPRLAFLMVNMLEEVMRSGTAAGVRSRGFVLPAGGKTGTSHDGWFAGFTSRLLCVVWVGYDDYRELNLEGAKSALPIWTAFMKKAAQLGAYREAVEFVAPPGVESIRLCVESGRVAGEFCTRTRTEVFISGSGPGPCTLHGEQGEPAAENAEEEVPVPEFLVPKP